MTRKITYMLKEVCFSCSAIKNSTVHQWCHQTIGFFWVMQPKFRKVGKFALYNIYFSVIVFFYFASSWTACSTSSCRWVAVYVPASGLHCMYLPLWIWSGDGKIVTFFYSVHGSGLLYVFVAGRFVFASGLYVSVSSLYMSLSLAVCLCSLSVAYCTCLWSIYVSVSGCMSLFSVSGFLYMSLVYRIYVPVSGCMSLFSVSGFLYISLVYSIYVPVSGCMSLFSVSGFLYMSLVYSICPCL